MIWHRAMLSCYWLVRAAASVTVTVLGAGLLLCGPASADSSGYSLYRVAVGHIPYTAAVNTATDTVYVANTVSRSVSVIDGATNTVTGTIGLSYRPMGVAVNPVTDTVYVTGGAATTGDIGVITVINGHTATITATIDEPLGTDAFGVAVDSSTNTVYVANITGDSVAVIDGATNTITATVSTPTHPVGLAVDDATDQVFASSDGNGVQPDPAIYGINAATDVLDWTTVLPGAAPGPSSVTVDPATGSVYVAGNSVYVLDAASGAVADTITSTGVVGAVAFDSQTASVWASTASGYPAYPLGSTSIISTAANTVTATLPRGGGDGMAISPSDGAGYIPAGSIPDATDDDNLWVIVPSAAPVDSPVITTRGASFDVGTPGTFQLGAAALPAATFSESGAMPAGLAFGPGGLVHGTPNPGTAGQYVVTITASNGVMPADTEPFTIDVYAVDTAPSITSPAAATFLAGHSGQFTVHADGYPAPNLTVTGRLPGGVQFDSMTAGSARLYGTPNKNAGGTYKIVISAQNGIGAAATQHLVVTVDQRPRFTTASHAKFTAGRQNEFTIRTGGYPRAKLTISGSLPAGIHFKALSNGAGRLYGTPPARLAGQKFVVVFAARNGIGKPVRQIFTLAIPRPGGR